VGELRSTRLRTCRLEYRFDRLLLDKLAQAYQLLVPEKRRPIGIRERTLESPEPITEISDEQAGSCLRAGLLDRQKENHSQTAALIEYAQTHEYSVPPEWIFQYEGYSGAVLVRPGLEALRDLAAEGQIAAALVYSPDRLSRKYAYQVLLSEELARCGVELIFLEVAGGGHTGGSASGAVPRYDRRIRTSADRGAVPAWQTAHGATGRGERAFRRTLWVLVCEEERYDGGLL